MQCVCVCVYLCIYAWVVKGCQVCVWVSGVCSIHACVWQYTYTLINLLTHIQTHTHRQIYKCLFTSRPIRSKFTAPVDESSSAKPFFRRRKRKKWKSEKRFRLKSCSVTLRSRNDSAGKSPAFCRPVVLSSKNIFLLHRQWIGLISLGVCPWQAFPALSNTGS